MSVHFDKNHKKWRCDFQINNNRYQPFCINPETNEPAKNKTEAKAIEAALKKQVKAEGQHIVISKVGFSFAMAMAHYLKLMKGRPSFDNIRTHAEELRDWFGSSRDLKEIDEDLIAEYTIFSQAQPFKTFVGFDEAGKKKFKIHPTRKRSPKTTNEYLKTLIRSLKQFRKAPEHKKYRSQIPAAPEIEFLKVPKRTPTPIPKSTTQDILKNSDPIRHAHLRLAYILCQQTGLREKECAKIREAQYGEGEGTILLTPEQTKTDTGRFIYVNEIAHKAIVECRKTGDLLWEILQEQPTLAEEYREKYKIFKRSDIHLILYRPHGTGIPRPVKHLASSGWKTMRKNAKASYRWHDTRAAFCTNTSEFDLVAAQTLAGHSDLGTTQRYLQAANPRLKKAVENMANENWIDVEEKSLTKVPHIERLLERRKRRKP